MAGYFRNQWPDDPRIRNVVALAITMAQDQASFIILMLGAGIVLLGAQWEALRRRVMGALPRFPGKDRLPPYDLITREPPL